MVFQGLRAPSKLGFCTGRLAHAGVADEDESEDCPALWLVNEHIEVLVLELVVEVAEEEVDRVDEPPEIDEALVTFDCEDVKEVLGEEVDTVLDETVDGPLLLVPDLTPLEVDDFRGGNGHKAAC